MKYLYCGLVTSNCLFCVLTLVQVNAFVGEHEQRCLHIAAGLGYVDMINLLAEFGANFNVQDRDGDTAVHFAVHG